MQHIMIDLEMNKIEKQWRGKNKLSSELIEIGAVRMDDHFEVVDTYQSYVKPEFGTMDAVIIDLTGITDDKVKDAPGFAEAMDDFTEWIGPGETQFYSWSMSDIQYLRVIRERSFSRWKRTGRTFRRSFGDFWDFTTASSSPMPYRRRIMSSRGHSIRHWQMRSIPRRSCGCPRIRSVS